MMNIFTIIHLLFIVYVLAVVPLFSKCHQTLFLHISILFLLLLHWITNNDVCVDGNRTVSSIPTKNVTNYSRIAWVLVRCTK